MNSVKKWWSNASTVEKILAIVAIIVILFLLAGVVRKMRVSWKVGQAKKMYDQYQTEVTGPGNAPYTFNAASVASAIYSAFYDNDWFGWTEDEEAAVIQILNVPKAFVPNVSDAYYNLYNKILVQDFQTYAKNDWSRIQSQFN